MIKRIKDNCADRVNVRAEADILKSLHHRFLPQVYDFIMSEDGIYTVMDYICGYDLKYYMDSGMVLDEAMLIRWMKRFVMCLIICIHSQQPIYTVILNRQYYDYRVRAMCELYVLMSR